MYKILKIGNVDYKVEYSIEASLYSDCTENVINLLKDTSDGNIENVIKGMSNVPQTTITLLYAGLLEHHGTEVGDGAVKSIADAKMLARQYLEDNKGTDSGNFYALLQILIEQMGEDNFLELIGLGDMIQTEEKPKKVPQDHKKKPTKKTEVSDK